MKERTYHCVPLMVTGQSPTSHVKVPALNDVDAVVGVVLH